MKSHGKASIARHLQSYTVRSNQLLRHEKSRARPQALFALVNNEVHNARAHMRNELFQSLDAHHL